MTSKESTPITSASIRAEIEEKKARIARLRAQRLQGHARDSTVSSPAPIDAQKPVSVPEKPQEDVKSLNAVASVTEETAAKPKEEVKEPEPPVELKMVVDQGVVDIVPKEVITYTKQTQTLPSLSQPAHDDSAKPSVATDVGTGMNPEDELLLKAPAKTEKTEGETEKAKEGDKEEGKLSSKEPEKTVITILSEEEVNSVGNSAQFTAFLSQTSRVLDRIISIDERFPDVTVNYFSGERRGGGGGRRHRFHRLPGGPRFGGKDGFGPSARDDEGAGVEKDDDGDDDDTAEKQLTVEEELKESRLSGSGRTVTCLNWSTIHPGLVLSSFSAPSAVNDAFGDAGVVLVWSIPNTTGSAECALTCQSEVMSAMFSPQQPHCVIGGTRAGQIVQWDLRSGGAPVSIVPPSRKTHSWPVYALSMTNPFPGIHRDSSAGMISSVFGRPDMAGKKSANMSTLASLGSDGSLCLWSPGSLVHPLECYKMPIDTSSREITSMTIPSYSESTYIVGCVDGNVMAYTAHGNKEGVLKMTDSTNKHTGAVLGADFHPPSRSRHASHVFLTASTDWTVKLWSTLEPQLPPCVLKTFPRFDDAVFDVRWSPVMPSVFAAADGSGKVSLWDISSPSTPKDSISLQNPVTRIRWNMSGSRLVAGTSAGTVIVLSVSDKWYKSRDVDSILSDLNAQQPQPITVSA